MKRSVLKRKTPLRAAPRSLKRSWMTKRPTRVKAGSDPKRRRWLRTLPCAVCGHAAPSEVSHERTKTTGLALKTPDKRAWPSCRPCHRHYEKRTGPFAVTDEKRKAWADATCALLQDGYARSFGAEPELREKIAS